MQHFLRTVAPATAGAGVVETAHEKYVEVLLRVQDGEIWRSAYVMRLSDDVAVAMTCWDQQFDQFFALLEGPKYKKYAAIYVEEYRKIWGSFFRLIDNALDERYGDGALLQFIDPDDLNRKWFFGVLVPISGADAEGDITKKLTEAVDRIAELSQQVAVEIPRQLSWKQKARIGAKSGAIGYREGKSLAENLKAKLDWLEKLS